jgi:Cbb3-type cytochrome oxidase component FixQ.
MATLDWIILVVFFLCLAGIVLWVVKHKTDFSL